jgi:hypothetical protein
MARNDIKFHLGTVRLQSSFCQAFVELLDEDLDLAVLSMPELKLHSNLASAWTTTNGKNLQVLAPHKQMPPHQNHVIMGTN